MFFELQQGDCTYHTTSLTSFLELLVAKTTSEYVAHGGPPHDPWETLDSVYISIFYSLEKQHEWEIKKFREGGTEDTLKRRIQTGAPGTPPASHL